MARIPPRERLIMHLKSRWRTLLSAGLLLAMAGTLSGASRPVPAGPQPKNAWKELSLIYLSDVKGKIEPCG